MSSKIEWTERTWNPVVGCSVTSPGCANCYAMRMAARLEAIDRSAGPNWRSTKHYAGLTESVNGNAVWTGKTALASDGSLRKPLSWKKPRRVFVNSMGDLFHESVPDEWIDRVFAVMALRPQHTFQLLTKRPARMLDYMNTALEGVEQARWAIAGPLPSLERFWPLSNVWLGVSAEDQQRANERIPCLVKTPAALRFVSCEPLLSSISLSKWLAVEHITLAGRPHWTERTGEVSKLDWIICGGETGPGARPMHPDWARSLRTQCRAASVPFFFKQFGAWVPSQAVAVRGEYTGGGIFFKPDGSYGCQGDFWDGKAAAMDKLARINSQKTRRYARHLDGVMYNEFPESRDDDG